MICNKILGKVTKFEENGLKLWEWRTDYGRGGGGHNVPPLGFIGLTHWIVRPYTPPEDILSVVARYVGERCNLI